MTTRLFVLAIACMVLRCKPTAAPAPIVSPIEPTAAPVRFSSAISSPALPLREGQRWSGYYVCMQGLTDLTLEITKVDGAKIEALFQFSYAPDDIKGGYTVLGHYQDEFGRLTFKPVRWVEQPPDYSMVGLRGNLSADGREYSGFVTDRSCAMFELRKI